MGKKIRNISLVRDEKGQSVVEYVLLLSVLVFIAYVIISSPMFRQWMGPNSNLFAELRRQMVYSYCNPMAPEPTSLESCEHNYQGLIESYQASDGSSRFFIPAEEYP